jgi:hypothetical protein
MHKFILIAAMVLASATAQAGQSRSLTLAANDGQPAADQAQPADAPKPAETPKYVERPAAVDTSTPAQPPKADAGRRVTARAERARHTDRWTEARIISELHRHGIYW